MTRQTLMKLNKKALIEIIMKLKEENRLFKNHIIYTCMECGKQFEHEQVEIEDSEGNVLCPYCHCGDIVKEFIND